MIRNSPWLTQVSEMRCPYWIGLVAVLTLTLIGCAPGSSKITPLPETGPSIEIRALATRYAPVIYQGAASDQDFITAVDFDGDWIGNNKMNDSMIRSAFIAPPFRLDERHFAAFRARLRTGLLAVSHAAPAEWRPSQHQG